MGGKSSVGQVNLPMTPHLTPENNPMMARFAEEYSKDFDATAACLRLGFNYQVAGQKGIEMLQEPVVQNYLDKGINAELDNPNLLRRKVVRMYLREANYTGENSSHAARVAALARLEKTITERFLQAEDDKEASNADLGGVMVVPEMGRTESWGKRASASQAKLTASVRD